MTWKHGRIKPVIGLVGGIGSGKSAVARLFEREGCAVIDADALAHEILQSNDVKQELHTWLGKGVIGTDGWVNRKAVGSLVFGDPAKLEQLNSIIHPRVAQRRTELMVKHLANPAVRAIIWDTPLLIEAGLAIDCDAVVFIKATKDIRLERVSRSRGWATEELDRREKLQISLDKKAELADYCVDNSGDEASSLRQVQRVLSHLSAKN